MPTSYRSRRKPTNKRYARKYRKPRSTYRRPTSKAVYRPRYPRPAPQIGAVGPQAFPDKTYRTLIYNDTNFDMTTNGSAITRHVFSGNSIFDPDVTGVGSQPYYFDQLAAIYGDYLVYGSKITIYLRTSTALTTCNNIRSYIWPTKGTAAPTYTETNDLNQLPRIRSATWNRETASKSMTSSGYQKMSAYAKSGPLLSISKYNDDLQANVTQNPAQRWYFQVITDTTDFGVAADILMDVKIKYYCKFFRRLTINES